MWEIYNSKRDNIKQRSRIGKKKKKKRTVACLLCCVQSKRTAVSMSDLEQSWLQCTVETTDIRTDISACFHEDLNLLSLRRVASPPETRSVIDCSRIRFRTTPHCEKSRITHAWVQTSAVVAVVVRKVAKYPNYQENCCSNRIECTRNKSEDHNRWKTRKQNLSL